MHVGARDSAAADAARAGAGQLRAEAALGRAEALHELCGVREHFEPLGVTRTKPGLPGTRCAALRSRALCSLRVGNTFYRTRALLLRAAQYQPLAATRQSHHFNPRSRWVVP